jgi:hypothetical protein
MKIDKWKVLGITNLVLITITFYIYESTYTNWYIHPLLIVRLAVYLSLLGGILTLFCKTRLWAIVGFVALATAWIGGIIYALSST